MGKRREVLVPGHLLHVPQPGRFHVRSQCPVHWPLHFHLRYCVTSRSGVHSTQGLRGQGIVTSVRDKAAASAYVATAMVVLSDFSAERLELPWAAAQEFLIAPPGMLEHLHTQRDALGQLSCYIPVKAPTSAARLCCPMANTQDVCFCTGKRRVVARCL